MLKGTGGSNPSLSASFLDMEKYPRGRRGSPAKGVGRVTGARVQIPASPHEKALKHKCFKAFLYANCTPFLAFERHFSYDI